MRKQLALFSIASFLFITSCKKKEDTFDLTPKPERKATTENKLEKLFANNSAKSESYKVNAVTGGSFTSTKGTTYTIPPDIFTKKDGSPVTGQVDILVKEITSPSEMILSDKPTGTNQGEMLKSFGEFKVDAFQGNDELILKPQAAINVAARVLVRDTILGGQKNEVPMWDGDTLYAVTSTGRDYENQDITITNLIRLSKGIDWKPTTDYASGEGSFLNFTVKKLGDWRNCDALYPRNNPTTVICYFTNVFNDSIVGSSYQGIEPNLCFFKRKGENTLVKLYNNILNPPAGKAGFLSYQNSFDEGLQGTFLVICSKGGKLYASSKDVTIGAPATGKTFFGIDFTLQEVTEAELLTLIAALNSK